MGPFSRESAFVPGRVPVGGQVVAARHEPPARSVPRHFPALDGLRGLAVLYVFLYHYGGGRHGRSAVVRIIGIICSLGWTGVTLFFLLSGFLITGLLWDAKGEPHWFRNFYIRRALRIWPLYYGTLALLLLWPLFDSRYNLHRVAGVVLIHASYLQNVPTYGWRWKQVPLPLWLEHYWTLAVEEQFYLLWPLLLFFVRSRRQGLVLCLGTVVLSIVFCWWNSHTALPAALSHSLPMHAGELGMGGGLALAFRDQFWPVVKRWAQVLGILGGVVFLVGMSALPALGNADMFATTWGLLAVTLAYGGLLASVLEPGRLQRVSSVRWLRWLGGISFGLYVFHLLFVLQFNELVHWMTGRHDGDWVFDVVRLVVVAAVTVALAFLSFHGYERPFLKLKSRFAAHRPVSPVLLPGGGARDTNLSAYTESSLQ